MFQALDLRTPALSAKLRLHIPLQPIGICALIVNMDPNSVVCSNLNATSMERMQSGYHNVLSWSEDCTG